MSSPARELASGLVCPLNHQPLVEVPGRDALYNSRLRKLYEIKAGIPVMLAAEAKHLSDTEHDEVMTLIADAPKASKKSKKNKE